MTSPVLTTLKPRDVRAQILADFASFLQRARSRPLVILYDKNWQNATPIVGETEAKFVEKLNDTGEGNLVIFGDNAEREWIVDELGEWEDLHVRVIYGGVEGVGAYEWTGKDATIVYECDDEGFEHITLNFIHEFEHVKRIICYPNPIFPAEFQYPKVFALAGGTCFNASSIIFLNLLRRFALPWTFSDNLFDPATWIANFNPANWPIVVVPKSFLFDTSAFSVISTRMGNLYDVLAPTLKDAGVQLKVYRWFPGMPQPAPNHYTLTKSTLVIDPVDKSGYKGPTGTVLDGIATVATQVASDLINEVTSIVGYTESPEYTTPGYFGTTRENPWVCFRNAFATRGISGVSKYKMTVHKATASSIVTGGKSPEWVNAGLKLLMNAALGYLGALIGNPALGLGIFESQIEDVVLAFHRTPNPIRVDQMGKNGPPLGELWESNGGTGFSLSALQAIRTGFYRSRAYTTFEVTLQAGKPYWPGMHFENGDRTIAEVGRSGRLYIEQINQIGLGWSRTQDPLFDVAMGDNHQEDTPGAILSRQLASVKGLVDAIGLST